jgi:hypothetical protein
MKKQKFVLLPRQIQILDELMEAQDKYAGICYHNENGEYVENMKNDLNKLKKLGFITEYIAEKHITPNSKKTKYSWIITYHGIAFLYAYHTK